MFFCLVQLKYFEPWVRDVIGKGTKAVAESNFQIVWVSGTQSAFFTNNSMRVAVNFL